MLWVCFITTMGVEVSYVTVSAYVSTCSISKTIILHRLCLCKCWMLREIQILSLFF